LKKELTKKKQHEDVRIATQILPIGEKSKKSKEDTGNKKESFKTLE
jgi:hypothetical protein